ncbi:MAG: ComF family protein [Ignavibacteriales bacterium]|nr:ComF family protein [Ignavibacteriales bacterium]
MKILGLLVRYLYALLDVFLPAECIACGMQVRGREAVCPACMASLKPVTEERRLFEYRKKFAVHGIVDGFYPAYVFEQDRPIRDILHAVKYTGKFLLAEDMGRHSANYFRHVPELVHCDIIIPVPLHKSKRFERGYNQSAHIAKGIARELKTPVYKNAVKRIKATKTQTKLNLTERRENMLDAFKMRNPNLVKGKSIMLVDDVITTGATITECAKVLKQAGAAAVFAVSVALAD